MMQPRGVVAVFVGILYTSTSQVVAQQQSLYQMARQLQAGVQVTAGQLVAQVQSQMTTTTTNTAWDSAISLSLSSGDYKSSSSIGNTLLSSSGGSSGTSSNSLNSDMSNSGDATSLGSERSGSSGLFLRIWTWVLFAILFGCCFVGLGGCCVAYMMKKQSKQPSNRRRRQADRDIELEPDFEMQQQTLLPEPPAYEPQQQFQEPPPVMEATREMMPPPLAPAAEANSYYTQYPGASNYMVQQPATVMQPMTQLPYGQLSFQQPAPGAVV